MMRAPFCLGIVFWGARFRSFFLEYCLPSLLAPGNIPADAGSESRFFICTTQEDWEALQQHPTFRMLGGHLVAERLPFAAPLAGESKMAAMSRGHMQIGEAMHACRAYGAYIYPDTVFSESALSAAEKLARAGKRVILAHCPRLANEGFLRELELAGALRAGAPIVLNSRRLLEMALRHMHSETLRYEWDKMYFHADAPAALFWRSSDGKELLFHSLAWAPILLDYGSLSAHDMRTLETWTIDGDYVHRNFPNPKDVHCVLDSDEITLISFTPERDLTFLPLKTPPAYRIPFLGKLYRYLAVRAFLNSAAVDPLKRWIFSQPARMRAGPDNGEWDSLCALAERVAQACLRPLSFWEKPVYKLLRAYNDGLRRRLRARLRLQ